VRIREVLERIEYDRAIFSAMLGGLDRKTLFLLVAEWRGIEQINEAVAARTGYRYPAPDGRDTGPRPSSPTASRADLFTLIRWRQNQEAEVAVQKG